MFQEIGILWPDIVWYLQRTVGNKKSKKTIEGSKQFRFSYNISWKFNIHLINYCIVLSLLKTCFSRYTRRPIKQSRNVSRSSLSVKSNTLETVESLRKEKKCTLTLKFSYINDFEFKGQWMMGTIKIDRLIIASNPFKLVGIRNLLKSKCLFLICFLSLF